MLSAKNVPLDVIHPVLDQLDRRDLVNATRVSWTFNRLATPLLYRTLDSRINENMVLFHPCTTLLRRPELAQYVRKTTETGTVQIFRRVDPNIIKDITAALRLCTHLKIAEYIDDTDSSKLNFLPILDVLVTLPLKELVIRTHHDVGEEAWTKLNKIRGICRLSIWSLDAGPPRVLQGWADELSPTLTHLELGRCAGVPPTILISVFMKLPLLRELQLKGVPSAAIPAIMGCLPNLVALDTEYLGSGNYRVPLTPLPALKRLTVRTRSVDILGPDRLWTWTRSLLPHVGSLESFTLNSFSVYGRLSIPWPFIVFLARKQGESFKELLLGDAEISLDAISLLCSDCPALETLVCSVASPDVTSIARAISSGNALRMLSLQVLWIEDAVAGPLATNFQLEVSEFDSDTSESEEGSQSRKPPDYSRSAVASRQVEFTPDEARDMMLRPGSKLREVRLDNTVYMGRWVLASTTSTLLNEKTIDGRLVFELVRDTTNGPWCEWHQTKTPAGGIWCRSQGWDS